MCAPDSTATITQSPGGFATETDEQRRVREGILSAKQDPMALTAAPDLADAALASQVRSNLLKNRLGSAGRKGTFLTGAMGDVTAPKNTSILGGY